MNTCGTTGGYSDASGEIEGFYDATFAYEVLTWNIPSVVRFFCAGGEVSLIVSLEGKMGSYLACCATTCLV